MGYEFLILEIKFTGETTNEISGTASGSGGTK